jgi:hypothetical protein
MKSKKLTAYKKVLAEMAEVKSILDGISDGLGEFSDIEISSNVTIQANSSDKQYVYAIGILNSQIQASKELGLDYTKLVENKVKLLLVRGLWKDREEWNQFYFELVQYSMDLKKLLSDDEKFELLEYPKKA